MAPVLPEMLSQAMYSLGTHDWSSPAASVTEKLTATEPHISSVIRAWFLGVFASIGTLFTSTWQAVDAGEGSNEHLWEWLTKSWQDLSEFLIRPDIRNALIVWSIVFWVCLVPLAFSLGLTDIIKDSLTAWFQAVIIWVFTPAGGLFTLIPSIGSHSITCPLVVIPSALIASLATWIAWSRVIGA